MHAEIEGWVMTSNPKQERIDLNRLIELAEKATPGPWLLEHEKLHYFKNDILANCDHCDEEPFVLAQLNRGMDRWQDDANFIAALNPEVVKTLVTALRDAVRALKGIRYSATNPRMVHDRTCLEALDDEAKQALKEISSVGIEVGE